MSAVAQSSITEKLQRWNCRDPSAWDALIPDIYDELKRKARSLLSKQKVAVFNPTTLVHELYIDFQDAIDVQWNNRQHFFAVMALAMRQLVVDEAVKKNALKRGGNYLQVTTGNFDIHTNKQFTAGLIDLDRALCKLDQVNSDCCRIVELRYFAGLSVEEVAEVMGSSERSIHRKWQWAKTWLYRHLKR